MGMRSVPALPKFSCGHPQLKRRELEVSDWQSAKRFVHGFPQLSTRFFINPQSPTSLKAKEIDLHFRLRQTMPKTLFD
jgi:hypothetical protein